MELMRKGRFSEQQIIAILKEHEAFQTIECRNYLVNAGYASF